MEHKPSYTAVPNETQSSTTRTTRENKNLRYELKVLQQPVRARACGSGSKSSADRRPVDPPPIVQLKVLEMKPGANGEEIAEDVTFVMNANYFLFATLEPARHLAQPRGMPDPNKPTVLTGTPVAGMVYLDRPNPAGYFIFPDLSVRHEGHFRLSFSLYEELKRSEDYDKLEDPSLASSQGETHVTHRLEVKSEVLQVFSAKKFPGLTESTSLSRTVAEQGCRVRIRRDVRMRRTNPRDAKSGKDWDEYEDSTADQRAKMARTADTPPYNYANHPHAAPPSVMEPTVRPRSASHGSHQSLAASLSRRQSQQELAQMYQQQQQQQQQPPQPQYGGTAPQTPQSGIMPSSAYGPSPSQQYSQPPYMQQPPQPLPQQQRQPMQPPPVQYQPQPHAYAPPPAVEQQTAHTGFAPAPTHQTQYAPAEANGHSHRASGDWSAAPVPVDYRRTSVNHAQSASTHAAPIAQPAQPSYPPQPYQHVSQPYQTHSPHQPHYYAPIEAQSTRAPPPEPIQPPHRTTAPTPPLSAKPFTGSYTLPPISHALEPASPAVHTPTSTNSYFPNSYIGQVSAAESHKRSYGSTFSTAHHDLAQKAGARSDSLPQTAAASMYTEFDVDDDDDDEGVLTAGYKRADGQVITRRY